MDGRTMSTCSGCAEDAGDATRCAKCRDYVRDQYVKKNGGIITKSCEHCASIYSGIARGMARRKYCSRKCKHDARRLKERQELIDDKLRAKRICPHCGSVVPETMRSHAVYCSRKCLHAAHSATTKARMKIMVGGDVKRIPRAYIIERDSGRCHLCRKKCRPSEIHLDHVIPLSKGGTHTLENLRVACAKCNMAKGARACNEQLMLVG